MTDEAMKDLVLKHDHTIEHLVHSVESLVASNAETNIQLKEIAKHLSNQLVLATKIEAIERENNDNFSRLNSRLRGLETTHDSQNGCRSVQLLQKEIEGTNKDLNGLAKKIRETEEKILEVNNHLGTIPPAKVMQWTAGIVIAYMISFGSYVVTSLQENKVNITKIMEHIK